MTQPPRQPHNSGQTGQQGPLPPPVAQPLPHRGQRPPGAARDAGIPQRPTHPAHGGPPPTQPPPGFRQPMPMYGAANTSAKSSTGPIIAVGIVVVLVAITGLGSTLASTRGGGDSSVAAADYTQQYQAAPHSRATAPP